MTEYLSGEAKSAAGEGRIAGEIFQITLISGTPYDDTMGFLVSSKLSLVELKSDDTMGFSSFLAKRNCPSSIFACRPGLTSTTSRKRNKRQIGQNTGKK